MAVFNEPTKWQTSLVNSGDANVIPQSTPVGTGEASFDDGFPQITQIPIGAGGIAPDRKDFNGLFKILGDWIFFNQNGGVSTYSENFDYVAGRVVSYNGNIYKCIQDNGALNKHAPTDAEYWLRFALNNESVDYLPLAGGNVTGNLSVQNKNVVRSVNGVDADESGNVTISSSCIPDYDSAINITSYFASSEAKQYTAPCDGVISVIDTGNGELDCFLMSKRVSKDSYPEYTIAGTDGESGDGGVYNAIIPKGMTVYLSSTYSGMNTSTGRVIFYPFK